MRSSRTDLNGGEREQEHVISASEEGGLQARANLNGGELDERPILPDREQPDVSWVWYKGTEDSAQPPDRPKRRRAGSRAGQTSKEAEEEIEERPRTNLNGGDLV